MLELADIPTDEVIKMKREGMANEDINKKLQEEGFSMAQISEAMTQANIKSGVEDYPSNPKGSPPSGAPGMESSELDKEPKEEEEIPVPTPTREPEKAPEGARPEGAYPAAMPAAGKPIVEDIQALVEEIISEKWSELVSTVGDLNIWRSKMSDDIEAVKQEIMRMQGRLENIQGAVLGKVNEYDRDIKAVASEMKALEKVFEKIMEPLVTNVKELSKITEELKKRK